MLSFDKDINISSGSFRAAFTDSTQIYAVTDVPDFRIYDWNGKLLNTPVTIGGTPIGCVLGYLGTAVVVGNYASVDFIATATGARTNVVTGAASTFGSAAQGQQIAAWAASGICVATRGGTTGAVTKINTITRTLTTLSPSSITGLIATCVIFKPDTNTFLVGTTNAKVTEIDANGAPLKTITLPTTPNISAPTVGISGLSYYNDILAVMTQQGMIYFYKYSTSAILYQLGSIPKIGGGTPAMGCLTDSASGTFMIVRSAGQVLNSTISVEECYAAVMPPVVSLTYDVALTAPFNGVIEPSLNKVIIIYGDSASFATQMRVYNMLSLIATTENTRAQDPLGIDVSQRVIRIRDSEGIGRSSVEVDQTLSTGDLPAACTFGHQYVELSLVPGSSPRRWDIREFRKS